MPHPNILRTLGPVRVEMKGAWSDSWVVRPNVIPLNASLAAGGIGQFQFRIPYGYLKHPSESAFGNHDYTEIQRQWVRVLRYPYGGSDLIWQGRVESEARELHGPSTGTPSGVQTFTAYCGASILSKRMVNKTIEVQLPGGGGTGTYETIDHLIPFNLHPFGRGTIKNRSLNPRSSGGFDHYVFRSPLIPTGETNDNESWRVRDAIEYLVAEFLNQSGSSATDPQFSIQIPAGELLDKVEPQQWQPAMSVMQMLQQLLNRYYGWGWAVLPITTGFQLRIASLAATAVTYDTITLPANPDVVTVDTADPDLTISLERSQVENYGKIIVRGAPMVVCRSFWTVTWELKDGWDPGDPAAFAAATPEERESGKWQNVWQRYVVEWDTSMWTAEQNPSVDSDGTLNTGVMAPLPLLNANVLESLPLYRGFDYATGDPPDDFEGDEQEFLPPSLYMRGGDGNWHDVVQKVGASLYVLPTNLGIHARVANPGVFALGTAQEDDVDDPQLDSFNVYATIAFHSAHRLLVVHEISGARDSDGVFVLDVPEAELWYLAPFTKLGVDADGSLVTTYLHRVLRNDRDKLLRVIVGVVARYTQSRNRAVVHARGLQAYGGDILKILGSVADATDSNLIAAPITGVVWQFEGDYTTTASTGYAF